MTHQPADHPVIRNMERTGYPDGKTPEYPRCPICDIEECGDVYVDKSGDVVGCEDCITADDAYEYADFIPDPEHHPDKTKCIICGAEGCETVYFRQEGNKVFVAGCDLCLTRTDAWQQDQCFRHKS